MGFSDLEWDDIKRVAGEVSLERKATIKAGAFVRELAMTAIQNHDRKRGKSR